MSVDTTVMILKTGDEYRVATVQAAENITQYNDLEIVKSYFDNKKVVSSLDDAYVLAEREEIDHERVIGFRSEYGMVIHNLGRSYPT